MGGKLHGRNMLISEYIFVLCVALLGSKEIFRIDNSNDSIEQMGRKQVSSHMQVVKKFFEDLRCCEFPFALRPLWAVTNVTIQSTSFSHRKRRRNLAQQIRTTFTRKKSKSRSNQTPSSPLSQRAASQTSSQTTSTSPPFSLSSRPSQCGRRLSRSSFPRPMCESETRWPMTPMMSHWTLRPSLI